MFLFYLEKVEKRDISTIQKWRRPSYERIRVWVHVVENISKKLPGIEPREINYNELLIKLSFYVYYNISVYFQKKYLTKFY